MGLFKTEYSRQFKKSSLDSDVQNYRECLDYRTYRRQLEHKHFFVEWDWDSESDSSEKSGGNLNNNSSNRVRQPALESDDLQKFPDTERRKESKNGPVSGPALPLTEAATKKNQSPTKRTAVDSQVKPKRWKSKSPLKQVKRCPQKTTSLIKSPIQKDASSPSSGEPTVRPFLAFGWADKTKRIGEKKTHNILASSDVYPAALRCHRRNVTNIKDHERAMRRGDSSHRRLMALFESPPLEDDVWLTEYQRHFSAHPVSV